MHAMSIIHCNVGHLKLTATSAGSVANAPISKVIFHFCKLFCSVVKSQRSCFLKKKNKIFNEEQSYRLISLAIHLNLLNRDSCESRRRADITRHPLLADYSPLNKASFYFRSEKPHAQPISIPVPFLLTSSLPSSPALSQSAPCFF